MRKLGSRLLMSQIGISFLVTFLLGLSTLTLARAYFLNSLEDALDVQAMLITEALFSGDIGMDEIALQNTEFNTVQQQIGNLSVEVQGFDTTNMTDLEAPTGLAQRVQAFETIELAVAFVSAEGIPLLQAETDKLPESFGLDVATKQGAGASPAATIQHANLTDWLVKSYPVEIDGVFQGFLTLGQPLDALQVILNDIAWRISGAGLAALLVASLISIVSSRGLLAPIRALISASQSIPEGKYDDPLPVDRKDELGQLSQTFDEMRQKLEVLEKMRAQFVSDVSHELRTPLTAIKGLSETLQDGAVEDPAVRDRFLASIEQETDRLIRMTQDLLTLTRFDTSNLNLSLSRVNLVSLLEELIMTLEPQFAKKQVTPRFARMQEEVILEADEDRLKQILINLLANAAQHAPEEGTIEIQLDRKSVQDESLLKEILIPEPFGGQRPTLNQLASQKAWAILKVQDTGGGINTKDLLHIFERFYRTDSSRVRSAGGAGLGLSIARALTLAHGGHIWLHSPLPGRNQSGTLVILMLPVVI